MTDHSAISTEPGPTSLTLAPPPTLRLNQRPLAFAFRIGLIVSFFLFGTCIGSAQTVTPVPVQGTCAAFAKEVIKGVPTTNGQCDTGKAVRGRCPGNAGLTAVTIVDINIFPTEKVTSGYHCSCDGKFNISADECDATCSGVPNCSVQRCIAIKPPAVCVKATMPPARDWMSVSIDPRMFVWDDLGRFPSPDCSNAEQAWEEHVRVHEEHHVNDINAVVSKYFKDNSGSVELAGCGASEDEAEEKLLSFVRAEVGLHIERVMDMLEKADKSFHQSPQGARLYAPFLEDANGDGEPEVDCSLCPALPPGSRGWCTINGPHKGERCRFSTSTEACRRQFKLYAPEDAIFKSPTPDDDQWYINHCQWERPTRGTAPTIVEFRCKEGSKRGTAPGTCEPSP